MIQPSNLSPPMILLVHTKINQNRKKNLQGEGLKGFLDKWQRSSILATPLAFKITSIGLLH